MSLRAFALAAVLAAPAQAEAPIPFESAGGLPLVEVRIAGHGGTHRFVLDTGAQPCVLDDGLARRLGLAIGGERSGHGGAGPFVANGIAAPPLELANGGAIACRDAIAIDLAEVSRGLGRRLDGVIGADFFRDQRAEIDYDRGMLQRGRDAVPRPPRDMRVAITIEGGRPYVDAELSLGAHRGVRRRLLVDTGSMDAVADALLDDAAGATHEARALGLGGGARIRLGRFERVVIGPHAWSDVRASVGPVSLVGTGLLSRHRVVIDYRERWIALLPRG